MGTGALVPQFCFVFASLGHRGRKYVKTEMISNVVKYMYMWTVFIWLPWVGLSLILSSNIKQKQRLGLDREIFPEFQGISILLQQCETHLSGEGTGRFHVFILQ